MTVLATADLHLDDNPRNADRWNLFPWLKTQAKKTGAKQLIIAGDVTDAKDRHNAKLVNRLVKEVWDLSGLLEVIISKGNHDFIDEPSPFFGFLNNSGFADRVRFINEPTELDLDDGTAEGGRTKRSTLILPCTKDWDANYGKLDFKPYRYIFAHQTFDGARSENGTQLPGVSPSVFASTKAGVFSGDIHVPQDVGRVHYIGAPYRIRFGDAFTPRVLLLRHGKSSDLHFPAKGRELIEARSLAAVKAAEFEMGTQVKIRIKLKRAEYATWPEIRKGVQELVERRGWELCGLELVAVKERQRESEEEVVVDNTTDPLEQLSEYNKRKKLGKPLRKTGRLLLKEVLK